VNATNSAAVVNAAFRAWIEAPTGATSPRARFVVRGWCYHRQGALITGVRMELGNRTFPGLYGDPRPDVHAAFNGESGSERSGYEIPVTSLPASSTGELQAQLHDGSWHTVESLAIDVIDATDSVDAIDGPHRGWRDRRRWGRFWWNAWRGRPDAWADLAEAERDFIVARARLRGWFNLVVAQQHAPRPLVRERFPAGRLSIERLPRITIVTPSLQQGPFLDQTIRSVLDQQDVRIDYIVQDGGSTDETVAVIRRYAARLAHWKSTGDAGQADAIVRGFSHSEGRPDDLMMYLNADDILMDGAVRFVAEYFARHPETDVVYGHRVLMDEDGSQVGRWMTPRPACDDLSLHDFVPQETLFWRRRIWDRVGGIDASFKFALDWDLLLRLRSAGARFDRLPWFLGGFRLHAGQKTNTRLQDDGIPEMDALRSRTLGRTPTHDELHLAMRRAQLDSALVYALFRRGWRV
jgi:GT2 family glycosyltransferase